MKIALTKILDSSGADKRNEKEAWNKAHLNMSNIIHTNRERDNAVRSVIYSIQIRSKTKWS